MSLRLGGLAIGSAVLVSALGLVSNDARACGGAFSPPPQPQVEATVVTGHRMALSISTTQTVLWDQVQYTGDPQDFAWVLPVKAGAVIEASNASWFEALDATTETRVLSPVLGCMNQGSEPQNTGCGCGSTADEVASANGNAAPSSPVQVIHEGTVGPYDTVTLKANVPGALTGWLQMHGYAIGTAEQPLIDAYTSEGFDFIALRLMPGAGVQQMKPVRVVSPGAVATLPLRMVAAGTGANVAITLFVIGEGRWETQNFPNATVDPSSLAWDFNASDSNYSGLRSATLAENGFRTWITSYAQRGTLFAQTETPNGGVVEYASSDSAPSLTIANAYLLQGMIDGEATSCTNLFIDSASTSEVVDVCDAMGQNCKTPGADQIDSREFACGTLDDLAVALTGLHPKDVWITRLEANLPHDALKDDLVLTASMNQTPVENWLTAQNAVNPPCSDSSSGFSGSSGSAGPAALLDPRGGGGSRPSRGARDLEMLAVAIAAIAIAAARRLRRASPRPNSLTA